MKFKVGDKVRIVKEQRYSVFKRQVLGETVIISEVHENLSNAKVGYSVLIYSEELEEEVNWPMAENELAMIQEKTKKAKEQITGGER